MFKVQVFEGKGLQEAAKVCIANKLYVSGWSLLPTLHNLISRSVPHRTAKLAVGYKNSLPVCLVLFEGSMTMAFCRKSERRNGYASKCVKALKLGDEAWAGEGVFGTLEFWRKNNIFASPRRSNYRNQS